MKAENLIVGLVLIVFGSGVIWTSFNSNLSVAVLILVPVGMFLVAIGTGAILWGQNK